jgi:hypothetical protein
MDAFGVFTREDRGACGFFRLEQHSTFAHEDQIGNVLVAMSNMFNARIFVSGFFATPILIII